MAQRGAYKALVGRQEHRDAGVDLADGQGHEHRCGSVPGAGGRLVGAVLEFGSQWGDGLGVGSYASLELQL